MIHCDGCCQRVFKSFRDNEISNIGLILLTTFVIKSLRNLLQKCLDVDIENNNKFLHSTI